MKAITLRLHTLDTSFHYARTQALMPHWDECLNVNGEWMLLSCHVYTECQNNVLSVFCCEAPSHIQDTGSLMCRISYDVVYLGMWISLFKLAIPTHEHAPVVFHKPYLLLEKSQFPHTLCFRIIRLRVGTCTWFWPRRAGCAGLLHTQGSTQRFIRNFCIPTQHQKQFHNTVYIWNKTHPLQLYSSTISRKCINLEPKQNALSS